MRKCIFIWQFAVIRFMIWLYNTNARPLRQTCNWISTESCFIPQFGILSSKQKDEKDLVLNEQPEKSSLVRSENKSFGVSKLLLRFRNLWIRKLKFKNIPYKSFAFSLRSLTEKPPRRDRNGVMDCFPIVELPSLNSGRLTHSRK